MELLYGIHVWNTCMETITIPHYLGLCRKVPNKGVFGWFKSSFEG